MESGEWKVENGKWRMESVELGGHLVLYQRIENIEWI